MAGVTHNNIWIVTGTCRCGTGTFSKALGIHHEYRLASLKTIESWQSSLSKEYPFKNYENKQKLASFLYDSIDQNRDFGDSNNQTIHCLDAIYELYPWTKFIYLVRNGKDWTTSALHRGYDQRNTFSTSPGTSDKIYSEWLQMSPISKCAWIWSNRNKIGINNLSKIPDTNKMIIKIEDCQKRNETQMAHKIENFLGFQIKNKKALWNKNNSDHLKNELYQNNWTPSQHHDFNKYGQKMMIKLGYEIGN